MWWLSSHPYAAASALAGFFLVLLALVVESRTSVSPGPLSVWGGTGAPLLNPTSYAPSKLQEAIQDTRGAYSGAPIYIPPAQSTAGEQNAEGSFDFESFLGSLTEPSGQSGTIAAGDAGLAYAFIPRGLIATNTPAMSRTAEQQALYTYGNDAASYIQTYEDSNRNAPVTLRDQAEDRQNPQKRQAVKLVAMGLRTAGESLLGMEVVPASVASVHRALAESYVAAGRALDRVPDASGDEAFIAAIQAYNAEADKLVANFVDLATTFSVSGVKFTTGDPGSIFTFSGGGGL
jgi:hypothetical protein